MSTPDTYSTSVTDPPSPLQEAREDACRRAADMLVLAEFHVRMARVPLELATKALLRPDETASDLRVGESLRTTRSSKLPGYMAKVRQELTETLEFFERAGKILNGE